MLASAPIPHSPPIPAGACDVPGRFITDSGSVGYMSAEIVRLIARLPLDVAANAGALLFARLAAGERRIDGRSQIGAGHGDAAVRPAVVELAAVYEVPIVVEQKEIGRTCSMISFGNILSFIVEIRKPIAARLGFR